MSALILKSTNTLDSNLDTLDFTVYKNRVLSDGGYIADEQAVKDTLAFIKANNITDAMAFSVTSPRWGLKLVSGKPNKLYSLFGSNGDIDISVGNAALIDLTTTSGFNAISLRATASNALLSGKVNGVNNAAMCVIAKPLTLASGSSYGSTATQFALGDLSNLGAATSVADRKARQVLANVYTRADATKMPADWHFRVVGFGGTGIADDNTSLANGWTSETSFIDSTGLYMYNAGNQINVDTTVTPVTYKDSVQFNVGRSASTGVQDLTYTAPLYADVAEAWCLVNTTSAIAQAVSLRASQKYA